MKSLGYAIGLAALLAPTLAAAQYRGSTGGTIPEPLSFGGAPSQNERFSADLAFRLTFLDEEENGLEVDRNANVYYLDLRGRVSPVLELTAIVPLADFSQDTTLLGVTASVDEADIGNPALGLLFTPSAQGPVRFAGGLSFGLPVADGDDADTVTALAAGLANTMNPTLYAGDLFSIRPEGRIAFDGGPVAVQALIGFDFGVDTDDDNVDEDVTLLRSGVSVAVKPVDTFALLGELTFVEDLDDNGGDNDFVEAHFGGRGNIRTVSGGSFQPGFEFFLPLDEDDRNGVNGLYEVGFALSLRGSI